MEDLITFGGVETRVDALESLTSSQTVDARAYAADGATIDITALQAAYNAAAGVKTIILPDGTHNLGTGRLTGSFRLLLKGSHPGACKITFTPQASPTSPVFLNGTTGTASLLGSNAVVGDSVLHPASTSGWAAGDILLLKSTQDFSASETGATRGEFVKVASIDSSTQLTLRGHIRDGYTTATSGSLAKVSFLDGVHIEGIGFQPLTPAGASTALVWLRYCRNVTINNCEVNGQSGTGFKLDSVLGFDIEDVLGKDGNEASPFGYSVVAGGASQNGSVHGCRVESGHALFSTGGSSLGGVPRNIVVSNCTASYMGDHPFHTHPACEDISFTGCQVTGSRTAAETSTYGPGFHISGKNCKVIDPIVNDIYGPGVYIDTPADGTIVRGGHVKRCLNGAGANLGTGISINGPNTRVQDYMVEGCDNCGVFVGAAGSRLLRGYIKAGGTSLTGVFVNDTSDTGWIDDLVVEDALVGVDFILPAAPSAHIRGLRGINTASLTDKAGAILASTVL